MLTVSRFSVMMGARGTTSSLCDGRRADGRRKESGAGSHPEDRDIFEWTIELTAIARSGFTINDH